MRPTHDLASAIIADALAYNAGFAEAAAEVTAGQPALLITAYSDHGSGWTVSAHAWWIVVCPDGGHAFAAPDPVAAFSGRRFDGRLSAHANVRRLIAEAEDAGLPIIEVGS